VKSYVDGVAAKERERVWAKYWILTTQLPQGKLLHWKREHGWPTEGKKHEITCHTETVPFGSKVNSKSWLNYPYTLVDCWNSSLMESLTKRIPKEYDNTQIWGHIFWNNFKFLILLLKPRTQPTEAMYSHNINLFLMFKRSTR